MVYIRADGRNFNTGVELSSSLWGCSVFAVTAQNVKCRHNGSHGLWR